jgi:hypothetical protein
MSGGHFDYNQCHIEDIAEKIEHLIASNNDDDIDYYGDPKGRFYSEETIEEFKQGLQALRIAYVYAQRIDWLVSGDDGEDSFHKRLRDELGQLAAEA